MSNTTDTKFIYDLNELSYYTEKPKRKERDNFLENELKPVTCINHMPMAMANM